TRAATATNATISGSMDAVNDTVPSPSVLPLRRRVYASGAADELARGPCFRGAAVLADDRHAVGAVRAERAAAVRAALELVGVAEAVGGKPRVVHAVRERAVVILGEPRVDAVRAAVVGAG